MTTLPRVSIDFTSSHRGGSGTPMVCVHGFTGTWRMWEPVLPALERHHDVLAPTLLGHAGGAALGDTVDEEVMVDALERAMDEVGFETAHIVGNSLGGYLALRLAERGRARTVVALAPAGGWAAGDESFKETLDFFVRTKALAASAAPYADQIAATPDGRRQATVMIAERSEHLPAELIAHLIVGMAKCDATDRLIDYALDVGWTLQPELITCPVRFLWGTADKLLTWPDAAARYRSEWLAGADWVELEGVGHCPQLDVPTETAQLILGFTAQPPGKERI
jgi:pimeloyl-ACP methyl ester carboxylesterase